MVVPPENRRILTSLNRVHLFNFDRPAPVAPRVEVTIYGGAKYVLENSERFKVASWGEGFAYLMGKGGSRFMLSGDTPFHAEQRACRVRSCTMMDGLVL